MLGLWLVFAIFTSKKSADPHVRKSAFYPWAVCLLVLFTFQIHRCAATENVGHKIATQLKTTIYIRLTAFVQDNLGKPAPCRKVNHSWFYWSERWWGCSGISWTICKSFPPRFRQITTPVPHHQFFTGRMPFLPPSQQRQNTEEKCKRWKCDTGVESTGKATAWKQNKGYWCCQPEFVITISVMHTRVSLSWKRQRHASLEIRWILHSYSRTDQNQPWY